MSVVIHYQRDGGEEGRYPPEGSVDVKQQSAVVSGQFDTEATYKVWLKVYEGQLTFPSKILQPLEATATTENKGTTPIYQISYLSNVFTMIFVLTTWAIFMLLSVNLGYHLAY